MSLSPCYSSSSFAQDKVARQCFRPSFITGLLNWLKLSRTSLSYVELEDFLEGRGEGTCMFVCVYWRIVKHRKVTLVVSPPPPLLPSLTSPSTPSSLPPHPISTIGFVVFIPLPGFKIQNTQFDISKIHSLILADLWLGCT